MPDPRRARRDAEQAARAALGDTLIDVAGQLGEAHAHARNRHHRATARHRLRLAERRHERAGGPRGPGGAGPGAVAGRNRVGGLGHAGGPPSGADRGPRGVRRRRRPAVAGPVRTGGCTQPGRGAGALAGPVPAGDRTGRRGRGGARRGRPGRGRRAAPSGAGAVGPADRPQPGGGGRDRLSPGAARPGRHPGHRPVPCRICRPTRGPPRRGRE
jgi:hypothetical protein